LLKEDKEVYILLENSKSTEVLKLLRELKGKVILTEDKSHYDIFQKNKLRIIDPTVIIGNEIFKASEKSELAKKLRKKALRKSEEGSFIKAFKVL